ncbi:cytochrome c family protein [Rhizobium sp. KVB221]|uniref:Cytochrome c family protein n=1 Tax=Rhizobium setariae TaxID=2801340 RepID=A0A936YI12_9HYPH|nr:cytochrome c family protein [Rhizobium setariae]MBL0370453.1 cytochrome c family protein [Rhizobium setariae]
MNSKVNMGLGALLGTVFVLFTVSLASESLFHSETPEKPGFEIAAAESTDGAGAAAEAPAAVPVADLMATADAARGEALFKKCASCHSAEKGAGNKVGPNLFGVVGRPIAHLGDFGYSGAMKEFAQGGKEVWDWDHLNHFLTAPKKYIKGTAMGFAGDKKDAERADLMAYLNSKSDSPLPLPTK